MCVYYLRFINYCNASKILSNPYFSSCTRRVLVNILYLIFMDARIRTGMCHFISDKETHYHKPILYFVEPLWLSCSASIETLPTSLIVYMYVYFESFDRFWWQLDTQHFWHRGISKCFTKSIRVCYIVSWALSHTFMQMYTHCPASGCPQLNYVLWGSFWVENSNKHGSDLQVFVKKMRMGILLRL
jgi:hypothetical protein